MVLKCIGNRNLFFFHDTQIYFVFLLTTELFTLQIIGTESYKRIWFTEGMDIHIFRATSNTCFEPCSYYFILTLMHGQVTYDRNVIHLFFLEL